MRADHHAAPSRPPARAAAPTRARPFTPPVSSATGTGRQPRQRAVVLLGQHLGRRHQRRLRAGLHRAQHGQQRHQRLARADIALQQPQHRGGATPGRRRSRPAPAPASAVSVWPKRASALARRLPSPASGAARPGAHPAAHQRQRHLVGQQLVIGEPRRGAVAPGSSPGACTARSASAKARPASPAAAARRSCHSGSVGQRAPAPGPWRCATWRGHSPAVSGQTGSIAGSRSGLVGRHDVVGMRHGQPAAEQLQLAGDQQLRARPASGRSRLNLKNTSSAKPVPSVTTTRQGWRGLAGGSWRTTSTARVAIWPGLRVRDGRAVRGGPGTIRAGGTAGRSPARRRAALGDQRADRRADAAAAWSAARKAARADRGSRADMEW